MQNGMREVLFFHTEKLDHEALSWSEQNIFRSSIILIYFIILICFEMCAFISALRNFIYLFFFF